MFSGLFCYSYIYFIYLSSDSLIFLSIHSFLPKWTQREIGRIPTSLVICMSSSKDFPSKLHLFSIPKLLFLFCIL